MREMEQIIYVCRIIKKQQQQQTDRLCESRGGATILRVGRTNITAREASRKFLVVVPPPHIRHSGGYNRYKERHTESLSDSVATISYWS